MARDKRISADDVVAQLRDGMTIGIGGWGSRLHKQAAGVYIAYAQWPDEATWAKAMDTRMHHTDDEARKMYREAIVPGTFETIAQGDVVADLLELRRP